ncbi:DNA polymerase III subunit delta' [Anaeromyxobacter dehalogenans]|nr:DNA polymerase III subunit delta' [Anaeromyxobacter dehalogenans]
MPFSELIAQERAVGSLRSALRRGSLHHAYLFGGPEGAGKARAALLLAQAANCEGGQAGPGGLREDPCGACGPCRKIERGLHPDVVVLAEERTMAKAGRWEPKSGRAPSKDIVVDQVRDLVDHRLAMKRFEGRRRFVVIDPADAMNPQAQNALLKTLEEPPEDTTLVLVASSPDALLPTIRSRCLRVSFRPLPADAVAARLQEEGVPAEEARVAAALSGGSLGRARAHAGDAARRPLRAVAQAAALRPDDAGAWLAWAADPGADPAQARGKDRDRKAEVKELAPEICELMLVWLRDVLAVQAGAGRLAVADLEPVTRRAAAALPPGEVVRRRGEVLRTLRALRQNATSQLALERLMIGWFHGGA